MFKTMTLALIMVLSIASFATESFASTETDATTEETTTTTSSEPTTSEETASTSSSTSWWWE